MWFGLTGVWWFLLALGYTLVGIGVMVAAVLGLTWLVARAAVDFAQHPRDCSCSKCQEERLRQLYHSHKNRPNKPRPPDHRDLKPTGNQNWISTLELRVGMYVAGRDPKMTYRVTVILWLPDEYVVHLININTRAKSTQHVPTERLMKPIWLLVASESGD